MGLDDLILEYGEGLLNFMNPFEKKNYVLYFGIAIVVFVLWLLWKSF